MLYRFSLAVQISYTIYPPLSYVEMSQETPHLIMKDWATIFSRIFININDVRSDERLNLTCRVDASKIATQLRIISASLESMSPWLIEPEIEHLCRKLLSELASIYSVGTYYLYNHYLV